MSRPPTFTVLCVTFVLMGRTPFGSGRSLDVGDAGVVGRPGAGAGPEELPVLLADRHVVDARLAAEHQPALVELPQLVAVAAEPAARSVAPLVSEPHRDPVVGERPERLDQPVVLFALPLAGEEGADLVAAGQELAAV